MTFSAYRNDMQCKQEALNRLMAMQKSEHLIPRPIYWNGSEGSLVGSVSRSDDLDAWESQLGLPKWSALAIDILFASGPSLKTSADWGLALLDAIPLGIDLSDAGSRMIADLLDGEVCGLSSAVGDRSLGEVLQSVVAFHRNILDGNTVEAADWRAVRRLAVTQTNTFPAGSIEALIGACVESAAWDARTSRTAVSDTCRSWINAANGISMARQSAWTQADDDRIKSLLDRLHADAKAQAPDDGRFIDVFKLLEEHHPDQATQLKAHIKLQKSSYAEQWERVTRRLQHVVATHAVDAQVVL